jgi:gliding motility-associated-like protein
LPDGSVVGADGSYPVTLVTTGGCDSTITTNLTVVPLVTTIVDISICSGANYTLPDGNVVAATGIFEVTLTGAAAGGCDSLIITNLTVLPVLISTQDVETCKGQSFVLPDGSMVSADGSYPVTIQNPAGCDSTITTNLTTVEPVASFVTNDVPSSKDPLVWFANTSSGAGSYSWDFGDGTMSSSASTSHVFPSEVGTTFTVCLIAIATATCSDTSCAAITIMDASVHVPNSFTPDGNGINDEFGPTLLTPDPITYEFEVYDRWGHVLFATTDPKLLWNGHFASGDEVPMGVYVWKLSLKYASPKDQYSAVGHVTLLR